MTGPPRDWSDAVAWLAKRCEYRRAQHQERHVEPRPLTMANVKVAADVELFIFNLAHTDWFASSNPMKPRGAR